MGKKKRRLIENQLLNFTFSSLFNDPSLSDCKLVLLPEIEPDVRYGEANNQQREELWVIRGLLSAPEHGE